MWRKRTVNGEGEVRRGRDGRENPDLIIGPLVTHSYKPPPSFLHNTLIKKQKKNIIIIIMIIIFTKIQTILTSKLFCLKRFKANEGKKRKRIVQKKKN